MNKISKLVSGALVGVMVLGGVSSASAYERYPHRHYYRHNGINPNALLLGAVGALAVGAIIANQHHYSPAYNDGYDSGYDGQVAYDGGYYAQPTYRSGYYYQSPAYYAPHHRQHFNSAWDNGRSFHRGY